MLLLAIDTCNEWPEVHAKYAMIVPTLLVHIMLVPMVKLNNYNRLLRRVLARPTQRLLRMQ